MGRSVSPDLRLRMVRGIASGKPRRAVAAQFGMTLRRLCACKPVLQPHRFLPPTLKPGDAVIMDNPGRHKGKAVRQLIRSIGAKLFFLQPYSPDLNLSSRSSPSANIGFADWPYALPKRSAKPSEKSSIASRPRSAETILLMQDMLPPKMIVL